MAFYCRRANHLKCFAIYIYCILISYVANCIGITQGKEIRQIRRIRALSCDFHCLHIGVSVGSSVMTIMFLSLDRYFAIRHPVKSRRITTTGHVTAVVVLIWAVSCGIMTPLATTRTLKSYDCPSGKFVPICIESWPSDRSRRIFDTFLFVFIYVLPGTVVGLSYTSTGRRLIHGDRSLRHQGSVVYSHVMAGRRRIARMLLLLAVLFAVSWMPYYAVSLYVGFGGKGALGESLVALSFALLLGHSHSAQNPILYCTMNRGFQKAVAALLRCDGRSSRSKDSQQVRYSF